MSFGGQTVKLVTLTPGTPGKRGIRPNDRSLTTVSGVHFRPFNTTETPDAETDVTTEIWKLTAPPEDAVLAMTSTGELVYDGTDNPTDVEANRFAIDGPILPKYDGAQVHHVTIMCKRQHG